MPVSWADGASHVTGGWGKLCLAEAKRHRSALSQRKGQRPASGFCRHKGRARPALIDLIVETTWKRLATRSPTERVALRCAYLGFGIRPAIRSRWACRASAVARANAGFARRCASNSGLEAGGDVELAPGDEIEGPAGDAAVMLWNARLRAIFNAVPRGAPWRIRSFTAARNCSRVIGGAYRSFGSNPAIRLRCVSRACPLTAARSGSARRVASTSSNEASVVAFDDWGVA